MSRICIVVEFTPKPGCFDAFHAHISAHAKATLAEEPGCERFDVMRVLDDKGTPDGAKIMLVEVYKDMDAVISHRANPRMPIVAEGTKPLLDGRTLTICAID
jgi:autoinducer 2-degrading protein